MSGNDEAHSEQMNTWFMPVIAIGCILALVLSVIALGLKLGWKADTPQEPFPRGEACYAAVANGVRYPSWFPPMFYDNGIIVAEDGHEVVEIFDVDAVLIDQDCLRERYPNPDNPSHPDPLDLNGDGRSDSPYYPPDDE